MPRYAYLHLDVFTANRFEGNQLAVFHEAQGIDPVLMATIAREINFSETTFILPAEREDTDVRMRIFTPGVELPIAGHPTIGSTFALAHLGRIAPPQHIWTYGLGVGPTRVELTWERDRLSFAWMDQQLPEVREPASPAADVLRAVGVSRSALSSHPVQEVSCGVPYLLLPLTSRDAVDAASPDSAALRALRSAFPGVQAAVYLFSLERVDEQVTAYCRMFAAGFGIAEDPATGSAAGPLGCYLVQQGIVTGDAAGTMVFWQGVAMRRPSRIRVAIGEQRGKVTRVQVGGEAVLVAEGTLTV